MYWKIENNQLVKEFEFKNQTDLAQFLLKIAVFSDSFKHHPDYSVFQCKKVRFTLITHNTNKITALDHQLAENIDVIFNQTIT